MALEISLGNILAIVVAIVIGVTTYLLNRRELRPAFSYEVATLHSKSHPEVNITFRDKEVENLTRLKFAFFNAGREVIKKEDLPEIIYPKVIFPITAKVLSSEIVAVSKPEIDLSLQNKSDNEVEIQFGFLNKNDGAVIDILFDTDEGNSKPQFKATIKGGKPPIVTEKTIYEKWFQWYLATLPIAFFLLAYMQYQHLLGLEPYSTVWGFNLFITVFWFLFACGASYYLYPRISKQLSLPSFAADHFQT